MDPERPELAELVALLRCEDAGDFLERARPRFEDLA